MTNIVDMDGNTLKVGDKVLLPTKSVQLVRGEIVEILARNYVKIQTVNGRITHKYTNRILLDTTDTFDNEKLKEKLIGMLDYNNGFSHIGILRRIVDEDGFVQYMMQFIPLNTTTSKKLKETISTKYDNNLTKEKNTILFATHCNTLVQFQQLIAKFLREDGKGL